MAARNYSLVICNTARFCQCANCPLQAMTVDDGVAWIASRVIAMKTIVFALFALSVLAGIAGPASALDTKTFWDQQERQSY